MAAVTILSGALILLPSLLLLRANGLPVKQTSGKTFASATWGVALYYPDGWTVDDDGEEVRFRSDKAEAITLGRARSENRSEPAPGRRGGKPACSTTTTAHDVFVTVCVEPATFSRRAVLVMRRRDGRQSRLALTTRGRDTQVFDAMVASARPYP